MSYGFAKGCRLHLKNDFKAVIKSGRRVGLGGITLWHKPAPFAHEGVRLGIVVSRKLGPAVVRNRTKRLLREAFRLSKERIASGTDLVVNPKDKLTNLQQSSEVLAELCRRAGIEANPSN